MGLQVIQLWLSIEGKASIMFCEVFLLKYRLKLLVTFKYASHFWTFREPQRSVYLKELQVIFLWLFKKNLSYRLWHTYRKMHKSGLDSLMHYWRAAGQCSCHPGDEQSVSSSRGPLPTPLQSLQPAPKIATVLTFKVIAWL